MLRALFTSLFKSVFAALAAQPRNIDKGLQAGACEGNRASVAVTTRPHRWNASLSSSVDRRNESTSALLLALNYALGAKALADALEFSRMWRSRSHHRCMSLNEASSALSSGSWYPASRLFKSIDSILAPWLGKPQGMGQQKAALHTRTAMAPVARLPNGPVSQSPRSASMKWAGAPSFLISQSLNAIALTACLAARSYGHEVPQAYV
jgi:hypothetical protein